MHPNDPSSDPTRRPLRRTRPLALVAATAATLVVLTACSAPGSSSGSDTGSDDAAPTDASTPHGYVEGASEGSEPQLRLATIDPEGRVDLLDLLTGDDETVAELEPADGLSTDGRFVFATRASGTVDVVDTGVWTVDHGDHSHYYRAEARQVGSIEATAGAAEEARVVPGADLTTVRFPASGEQIVLDTEALGAGEIDEVARFDGAGTGALGGEGVLVPFGDSLLSSTVADLGPDVVAVLDREGRPVDGAEAECVDPRGSIETRVGVVIGCADGALLATTGEAAADAGDGEGATGEGSGEADADADAADAAASAPVVFERIPYPEAVAADERAVAFDGRRGRPTVAAVAGDRGAWLLDTRERSWSLVETPAPLVRVSAVDDSDGHVVGLDALGRVVVLTRDDGVVATTDPLLPSTVADDTALAGVSLSVDASRAYLNGPLEGAVFEIDYADGGRVSRTFDHVDAPSFAAETGR
ncbi:ABC transporter [Frigoribacterium sp. CFBP 13712]|uniref:ABC transporter n=1 Tax=Frigoribacterium sp. CFBP 13712 TaxID=2775309 RepID=UPI00177F7B3F|nr:ABC transporter [Frigoribacterium sp. CFBP 13712]MBD8702915.1 ABC transporter [Frigoribacterium sp. CFBP 13712]